MHELTIQNLQSLNHPVYEKNQKMKCYLGDQKRIKFTCVDRNSIMKLMTLSVDMQITTIF